MIKLFLSIIFLLIIVTFPEFSFSDIIYLNNGKKIEGRIIEKSDKKIRITVSGGTIEFNMSTVKEIQEDEFIIPENTSVNEVTINSQSPTDFEIVKEMAEQDINRSISGIKVKDIRCNHSYAKGYDKCIKANVQYISRYKDDVTNESIELVYKYNAVTNQWVRPKKTDILQIAAPNDIFTNSEINSNNNSGDGYITKEGQWKKEYKIKGTVRKHRRLIGPGQPKDDE